MCEKDNKGEEGELACLCLVSALVIQLVLLCSVIWRFVLCATRSGHHLLIVCIPHGVLFVNLLFFCTLSTPLL